MLNINRVKKSYGRGKLKQKRPIVKGVSFNCESGKSIGIIGESGSGKSTLGRMIVGIEKPDSGIVTLDGKPVYNKSVRKGRVSAVFQNYKSSIHPYFKVEDVIKEPLKVIHNAKSKSEIDKEIVEILKAVGLDESYLNLYPHMLSGGEAQRVAIARAMIMKPDYVLLDEAISSLDMSIQTQILNLLIELRALYGVSYIFITHDIQAATYICEDLIIFKDGLIQESLHISNLKDSTHPYTNALLEKQLIT
ncbi:ABC transporter ATP-binding protein [Mammaliicoccus stepanovicii]|nr:ABC transporter ATP-binding protein [Mammaliicoccus stepanovicii]PNZ78061.1 peptide ABC transporter ATP-binding protein [Mammaliicoccus stepanovicii]GGI40259.1 ABC transporter ATP-binding protein [Mammaliicoccus stepanovicii]